MKIIGIATRASNQAPEKIGAFWHQFFANNITSLIPNTISPHIFCLYTDYEGDHTNPYKMIIGHEVSTLDHIPAGLEGREFEYEHYDHITLPQGNPESTLKAWQEIWANGRPRAYKLDFQKHNPDGSVDIFVEYK